MFILKAERLSKEINGIPLFKDGNIEISEGEHVAIVGSNGVGKTTLLRMLLGEATIDGGTIYRRNPVNEWGVMEQQVEQDGNLRLLDFVQSGEPLLYKVKRKMDEIERLFTSSDQGIQASVEQIALNALVQEYSDIQDEYIQLNGYEWEKEIEKCLQRLKLPPSEWLIPYEQLSGGQKTKAQFARISVHKPKFLLLDEPTNHLDSETLDWLELWLNDFKGSVIFVSHDRYFIDRTAHSTIELTSAGTKRYKGGFSDFRIQRELEEKTQMALYRKQQQERKDLKEAIERYRQWFKLAIGAASVRDAAAQKSATKHIKKAQSKEKALERLNRDGVQMLKETPTLHVRFDEDFEVKTLLRAEQLSFSFLDKLMFCNLSLSVKRGDRIAVTGPNGVGKTTLLKLLTGKLQPDDGKVLHHPQLKVGYFAQELEELQESKTILDSILELPNMTQSNARTILACFLFRKEDVFKPISKLSMGEKCRVALVRLYFSGANLLVLDEPTNYLDIETRERLEEALIEYPGAMIIVSHDRYLIQKVANRIFHLDGNEVTMFQGSYGEYSDHMRSNDAPMDVATDNEVRQLELQLTNYVCAELPETPEEQKKRKKMIKEIKNQINLLKSQSIANKP